jgi:hypothetical protein
MRNRHAAWHCHAAGHIPPPVVDPVGPHAGGPWSGEHVAACGLSDCWSALGIGFCVKPVGPGTARPEALAGLRASGSAKVFRSKISGS